jgi:hypothetical protein
MLMDEKEVLGLFARREGADLDFKSMAYPAGSGAELAKDLMSMANLLANGERAYILLGIPEDALGNAGPPVDVGTLDDAGYHQMVEGKLNRTRRASRFSHTGSRAG